MGDYSMSDFRRELERRRLEGAMPRRRRASRNGQVGVVAIESDIDPSSLTIKRLAWAFGSAAEDSEIESKLYRALVAKVEQILAARREHR